MTRSHPMNKYDFSQPFAKSAILGSIDFIVLLFAIYLKLLNSKDTIIYERDIYQKRVCFNTKCKKSIFTNSSFSLFSPTNINHYNQLKNLMPSDSSFFVSS